MESNRSKGKAVQIVKSDDENSFTLDEKALSGILLDPRVRNSKVMVLSVAGAYRKGKSFLLNFFLRYLNNLNNGVGSSDWMGPKDKPLEGFNWRGGSERTTSGILMWSEPYFISKPNGEKICILLMDTQGAFDSMSTVKECATVFALSTMLSSVQVYNITSNIQEDDLQHLELFTEYGRLALETYDGKPFQTLHFLVRDWQYPYQYPYGAEGGKNLLDTRMLVKENQPEELQKLRRHLNDCFKYIGCFLMAHPGLTVATSSAFVGKLRDIEENFQANVKQFIEDIFKPSHIVIKKINGNPITGKELVEYFKAYMKVYQGQDLPEPKSMLDATAEANNLAAVANAKDLYTREMEKVCGGDKPYMKDTQLTRAHDKLFMDAMKLFVTTKKMGGDEFSKKYEAQLEKELLTMFENHQKNNLAKNVMTSVQTPIFYVLVAIMFYILSGLCALLGLSDFANYINIAMMGAFICLFVWSYTRYTGKFRVAGEYLDQIAKKAYQLVLNKDVEMDTGSMIRGAATVYSAGKNKHN